MTPDYAKMASRLDWIPQDETVCFQSMLLLIDRMSIHPSSDPSVTTCSQNGPGWAKMLPECPQEGPEEQFTAAQKQLRSDPEAAQKQHSGSADAAQKHRKRSPLETPTQPRASSSQQPAAAAAAAAAGRVATGGAAAAVECTQHTPERSQEALKWS